MANALWKPNRDDIANSNLSRYQSYLIDQQILTKVFESYDKLHQWSTQKRNTFWFSLIGFFKIVYSGDASTAIQQQDHMVEARWFPDMKLNFAENLLRARDDLTAIICVQENNQRNTYSYGELKEKVRQLQHSLICLGVKEGDRVAALMPNTAETLIAMLATTSLGAIWSSCSPDFGVNGVIDRFEQIQPKALFACDGYYYNGKTIPCEHKLQQITEKLDCLENLIITPIINDDSLVDRLKERTNCHQFTDFLSNDKQHRLEFKRLSFDHPLYILYSSGTTGKPKCIVHGAGGTLLQHLKELALHTDIKSQDCLFYYTTCGWMMWNWMISGIALGATLVLYDGSPFYPHTERIIDLIDDEKINVFGCSAKYISALEKADVKPIHTHRLESLQTILSTGSPLSPASFEYIYRDFKKSVRLNSISGGTDIISCFVLGNPLLPVYSGEIQCAGLGMDVKIFNSSGQEIVGQKGELVCLKSFPSMPIYFWKDANKKRYFSSYFETFPGIWTHGDYGEITANGGFVISGRSDTILNPGGIRIGTAEIYRAVEPIPQVLDSVVIGQPWKDDVRVVLFVQLKEGIQLSEVLSEEIRQKIRHDLSPRHVPKKVIQVSDIPKTLSGKVVELAVSAAVRGEQIKNLDALANPEALIEFKNRKELKE